MFLSAWFLSIVFVLAVIGAGALGYGAGLGRRARRRPVAFEGSSASASRVQSNPVLRQGPVCQALLPERGRARERESDPELAQTTTLPRLRAFAAHEGVATSLYNLKDLLGGHSTGDSKDAR